MSRVFEASYPSRCSEDDCPDPSIREGERVMYDGSDRLVHAACPEPEPPPQTCPRCFMAYSLSGACGCD